MTKKEELLRKFLEKLPAFQAVFRVVEAEGLAGYDLKEPILDLGCGDGIFTEVFLGKGKKIIGVDIDEKALTEAKKRDVYQELVKAKAGSLPFRNDQFKTVLANSSLEHIKNLKPSLEEIYRVLTKGGTLVLTAPSEKRKKYFAGRLHNHFFGHRHCWSGKKWQRELGKVGFRKIDYQYLASNRTCFLSGLFLVFCPIGWLEKKLFGCFLGWRKLTTPALYLFLKNFPDEVLDEDGAVIVVKAEK